MNIKARIHVRDYVKKVFFAFILFLRCSLSCHVDIRNDIRIKAVNCILNYRESFFLLVSESVGVIVS